MYQLKRIPHENPHLMFDLVLGSSHKKAGVTKEEDVTTNCQEKDEQPNPGRFHSKQLEGEEDADI